MSTRKYNTTKRLSYSLDLATKICSEIAKGNSLSSVCKNEGMPEITTCYDWLRLHDEFTNMYVQACEDRTESDIDEIKSLEDKCLNEIKNCEDSKIANAIVQAYRLKIDTRKWVASKLKARKYGDSLAVDHHGSLQINIADNTSSNQSNPLNRQCK